MGLKKRSENMCNKLLKGYRFRSLTKMSFYSVVRRRGLETIYLIILFALSAGVVNAMLEGSKLSYIYSIILPSRSVQTWSEALINFFIIILGTMGIYMMYQSGQHSVGRRSLNIYLVLGLVLTIMAVFVGFSILAEKGF